MRHENLSWLRRSDQQASLVLAFRWGCCGYDLFSITTIAFGETVTRFLAHATARPSCLIGSLRFALHFHLDLRPSATALICDLEIPPWSATLKYRLDLRPWNTALICDLEFPPWSAAFNYRLNLRHWNVTLICDLPLPPWSSNLNNRLDLLPWTPALICGLELWPSTTALICDLELPP